MISTSSATVASVPSPSGLTAPIRPSSLLCAYSMAVNRSSIDDAEQSECATCPPSARWRCPLASLARRVHRPCSTVAAVPLTIGRSGHAEIQPAD